MYTIYILYYVCNKCVYIYIYYSIYHRTDILYYIYNVVIKPLQTSPSWPNLPPNGFSFFHPRDDGDFGVALDPCSILLIHSHGTMYHIENKYPMLISMVPAILNLDGG